MGVSTRPQRRPIIMLSLLVLSMSMLACMLLVASKAVTPWPATVRIRASFEERMLLGSVAPERRAAGEFAQCRGAAPGEEVPPLLSVQRWRGGNRARRRESITLVTQLSLERLDMLANQCSVWPDVLAAVIFVPTVENSIVSDSDLGGRVVGDAAARLQEFHERMQEHGACTLDLELATQDFPSEEEAGLYPFNAARNMALQLAQTEALLLLDVDFVPSPAWVAEYNSGEGYARLLGMLNKPQVIVVPSFEIVKNSTGGKQLALAAARGGKDFIVREYLNGSLDGFQLKKYRKGHYCTNFDRWAEESQLYTIKYCKGYEPFVLASRRFVPWYDERFRGYGKDKIQHIAHLAGLNVTFSVHPTAFSVHVPHSKGATNKITARSGQTEKLAKLYHRVLEDLEQRRFVPVVAHSAQLCSDQSEQA